MDCGKYIRQISKYIDGELSDQAGKMLATHLSECSECRRFYSRMTAINETLCSTAAEYDHRALISRVKDRLGETDLSKRMAFPILRKLPAYGLLLILALGLGNLAGNSLCRIIPHREANGTLELLAPEHENSLAEAILDIGVQENSK